jgi:predicted ATPase
LLLPQIAEAQELWKKTWDVLSEMRCYELSPYGMAAPSPIGQRTVLDRNGTNVGDVVSHLLERPEDHAWVNRHLGAVTDGIEAVGVRVDDGYRRLQLTQSTGPGAHQTLSARQVSQGTLRALGVLLSLRQLPAPSLVVLDEIEDSIHPLAVDVLLEAIEQSCERFPIVVTTHSPEVLGRKPAKGERVRVLQWRDGVSQVHRLGKGTLEQLDAVTTVGWLLSTNGLGLSQPQDTWSGDLLEWR